VRTYKAGYFAIIDKCMYKKAFGKWFINHQCMLSTSPSKSWLEYNVCLYESS